jgi:predicted DNA-binding transcriptional regulator YafY
MSGEPGDLVEIELRYPDTAASWIAGFGPDVVVLEPDVLAKSVRERLLGALARGEPGGGNASDAGRNGTGEAIR